MPVSRNPLKLDLGPGNTSAASTINRLLADEQAARDKAQEEAAEQAKAAQVTARVTPYAAEIERRIDERFGGRLEIANTEAGRTARQQIVASTIVDLARQGQIDASTRDVLLNEIRPELDKRYGGRTYVPFEGLVTGSALAAPAPAGSITPATNADGELEDDGFFADAAKGLGVGIATGVGGLATFLGSISNGVADVFRGEDTTPDNFLTEFGTYMQETAAYARENQVSETIQDADRRLAESDSILDSVQIYLEDPTYRFGEMVGWVLGSAGPAGGTRALAAKGLGRLGQVGAAQKLGGSAASMGTLAAGQGAGVGGNVEFETRGYLNAMPDQEFFNAPLAVEVRQRLGTAATDDRVRHEVTETLARRSRNIGFAAGAAGMLMGSSTELLAMQAARAVTSRSLAPFGAGLGRTATARVAGGAAVEAAGEFVQEGGQELALQVGRDQVIDPQAIINAGTFGAILGAGFGGTAGAIQSVAQRTPSESDSGDADSAIEPVTAKELEDNAAAVLDAAAQVDQDIATAVADTQGILDVVREGRDSIIADWKTVSAEYEAAQVAEVDSLLGRAKIETQGQNARAQGGRSLMAFDNLLAAETARRVGGRFERATLGTTTSAQAVAAVQGDLTSNPLEAATRRERAAVVEAQGNSVLPPRAIDSLENLYNKGSVLLESTRPMFTPRNAETREQAVFDRLTGAGVDPALASGFATRVSTIRDDGSPIPAGEMDAVVEQILQENPEFQPAARVFQEALNSYRDVRRARSRVRSLVNNAQLGDAAAVDRALGRASFVASIEGLETATALPPAGGAPASPESAPAVPNQGPPINAKQVRAADAAKPIAQSFKQLISQPLDIRRNAGDLSRSLLAPLARRINDMDSLQALDRLQLSANAKKADLGIDQLNTDVHNEFAINALGKLEQGDRRIREQFHEPMLDLIDDAVADSGVSDAEVRADLNTYLESRSIVERIPAVWRQRTNQLNRKGTEAYKAVILEVETGQGNIEPLRQQLDDIFNDKSNYSQPSKMVPVDQFTYRGKTIEQAQAEVDRLAAGPLGEHLARMGAKMDEAAATVRTLQGGANIGGRPVSRLMQLNDFHHYVPFVLDQTEPDGFATVDEFNARNAGRKRMGYSDETQLKDITDRMMVALGRANQMAAEASFFDALANNIEVQNNTAVGTVERGLQRKFDTKTGRHFYERFPTAAESNVFVRWNDDGSFDRITVTDEEVRALLVDRFAPVEESGKIMNAVEEVTRFRARTFTSLNPAFLYTTSMWRAASEGFGQVLQGSTFAGSVPDVYRQAVNVMSAAWQGFPILSAVRAGSDSRVNPLLDKRPMFDFYTADSDRQQAMAEQWAKSDNEILKVAAARYKQIGVAGFKKQLPGNELFASQAEARAKRDSGVRAAVERNGWGAVKKQTEGAMTTMDQMFRNATVLTLTERGMPMKEAIEHVERQYNVRQRSGLSIAGASADSLTKVFAFYNAGSTGANAALTRRPFREGSVPASVQIDPETGQETVGVQTGADLANTIQAISGPQAVFYTMLGIGSTSMAVMAMGNEEDEDGVVRPSAHKLPAFRLMTTFMVPEMMDENGVPEPTKIPTEYGWQMLVQGLASGAVLVANGTHSLEEVKDAYIQIALASLLPVGRVDPNAVANAESRDDLLRTLITGFTPTAIDVPVQAALNQNGFGGTIFNADNPDALLQEPELDQAGNPTVRPSTQGALGGLFEGVAELMGDLPFAEQLNLHSPDAVKHFFRGYGGYPAQLMLSISSEARRSVEDPTYEGSDWMRRVPVTPFRSEQGARWSASQQVFAITSDIMSPMRRELRQAQEAAEAGDYTAVAAFNKRNPDYVVAAGLTQAYFDENKLIGEQLDLARSRDDTGYKPERIKELTLQRDRLQDKFLRDWYNAFPNTRPEEADQFEATMRRD